MAFADQSSFSVTCECGATNLRSPNWLRKNTSPLCPVCGADITEARNRTIEQVVETERELASPI
jgi:hypothetical protein